MCDMYDMYDMYEELLSEKEKEIEQLEVQVEQCQQEIRRLYNVCRCYEKEIRQEWELVSFEDILKRLGVEVSFTTGHGKSIVWDAVSIPKQNAENMIILAIRLWAKPVDQQNANVRKES